MNVRELARERGAMFPPALVVGWSGTAVLLDRLRLPLPFADQLVSARTAPARAFGEKRLELRNEIAVGWARADGSHEWTFGTQVALFDSVVDALDLWLLASCDQPGLRAVSVKYSKT